MDITVRDLATGAALIGSAIAAYVAGKLSPLEVRVKVLEDASKTTQSIVPDVAVLKSEVTGLKAQVSAVAADIKKLEETMRDQTAVLDAVLEAVNRITPQKA